MRRTHRALATIVVVATLATGTVAACTGPPPSEAAWRQLFENIGLVIVVNVFTALGWCFLPCLPVPTGPGTGPVDTTPPPVTP